MKKSVLSALISIALLSWFARAEVVGYAIVSDIGIGDQVAIFNGTGPINGCSTSAGFPVCTNSFFNSATLSVNGGAAVALGDIGASGYTSTTYAYGSLTSLLFQAVFSPGSIIDDGGNHFNVPDPTISVLIPLPDPRTGFASPALITIENSEPTTTVPEPSFLFAFGAVLCGLGASRWWVGLRRSRHLGRV